FARDHHAEPLLTHWPANRTLTPLKGAGRPRGEFALACGTRGERGKRGASARAGSSAWPTASVRPSATAASNGAHSRSLNTHAYDRSACQHERSWNDTSARVCSPWASQPSRGSD